MVFRSQDLRSLKEKLLNVERELARETKALAETPDFGSDVDGLEEEAEETEAIGVNLSIENVFKGRLELVREALRKMDEGTYGVCERCKQEIELELLQVVPESELCKACKAKK